MNVQEILENIKTTENDKLLIKLLTGLGTILPSQMPHERDEIVTSSVVYEAAHSILSRGTFEGSTSVLSFLTGLLRAASGSEEPARASAARELLRRSGCLHDMLELFLGTEMMEQERLKVLCECLVESCKNCVHNQNYCNRLIPAVSYVLTDFKFLRLYVESYTCLKQWDDRNNNEKLKLLQCLLLNNTRNINTFVECNGIATIFTRDTIQESSTMELLSIVVQNPMAADLLQRDTDLVKFLFTIEENHKVKHQGSLKLVEWASVILFHIASHIEGTDNSGQKSYKMEIENEIKNTESSKSDLSVSFLFKPNWDKIQPTNIFKNNKTGNTISEYILEKSAISLKRFCLGASSSDQISLNSSIFGMVTESQFRPDYASTPIKKFKTDKCDDESKVGESSKEQKKRKEQTSNIYLQRNICGNNPAPPVKTKLSTSARLFNIVNNSCVSIYNMMGNVFFRSTPYKRRREDILKPNLNIAEMPKCRFNNYKKPTDSHHADLKDTVRLSWKNSLKRKFGINKKYRKGIIQKLKTGIHFYGCDFKKIAQAMWPQEKQMTAQVLYSIYRKFIVK